MPFSAVDPESVKDIECNICLEPWDDPVELEPCRHVYCRRCTESLRTCPDCRATISNRKQPNRILINMSNGVMVRCEACRWQGTREASRSHRNCLPAAPPTAPPIGVGPSSSAPHVPRPATATQQQPNGINAQPAQQINAWTPQSAPSANSWAPQPAPRPAFDPSAPWAQYGLDQEEYDHIMAVFMTFDDDGSNELDRREVTKLCRWLNFAHSEADIDRMFRDMDSDRSGKLSLDEFCRWLSTHRPDPQALYGLSRIKYDEVLFAFHTFDTNQDGRLNQNEFVGLAQRQGWARTDVEGRNLFVMIDTDRSGYIDLHELLTFRSRQNATGAYAPAPPAPQSHSQPAGQGGYPPNPYNGYYAPPHGQPPPTQMQSPHHDGPPPPPYGYGVPPGPQGYYGRPPPPQQQQQQQQQYGYPPYQQQTGPQGQWGR
jgi:Ca2+-binding EF-hand superfamily protein